MTPNQARRRGKRAGDISAYHLKSAQQKVGWQNTDIETVRAKKTIVKKRKGVGQWQCSEERQRPKKS
nr:MAG TPA: hypothetical protein [Caudoviricetes sp.]